MLSLNSVLNTAYVGHESAVVSFLVASSLLYVVDRRLELTRVVLRKQVVVYFERPLSDVVLLLERTALLRVVLSTSLRGDHGLAVPLIKHLRVLTVHRQLHIVVLGQTLQLLSILHLARALNPTALTDHVLDALHPRAIGLDESLRLDECLRVSLLVEGSPLFVSEARIILRNHGLVWDENRVGVAFYSIVVQLILKALVDEHLRLSVQVVGGSD